MDTRDEEHLRAAFAVARRSREHGNHPFGAILAGPDGERLLEAENTVVTERDCTGHAETNLVREASRRYDRDFLAGCTLYASTEPCAMCAAATYWANVRRVVFGLDEATLGELTGDDPENPTLSLPAARVLAAGRFPVAVIGPALREEARLDHEGFWHPRP